MDFKNFQLHDLFILIPALICLVLSIILYSTSKNEKLWPALLFLTLASLGLRIFMAHLDPFLWDWDERYHALVAKNLMLHPFKPTLFDKPVFIYDYKDWTTNYIWMHKQPLPLWQMAVSFSLFGINQFTARFPMVIEGALMTLLIFRIGSLAVNKQVGYLSALIYTSSFYALDFMTGGEALDHIDFALIFYVSASLWTWLEFRDSKKMKWAVLTGVFAGLAFMSKWILGLLIFPVWGIEILIYERKNITSYLRIGLAFLISAVIFLPWQIYAYLRFPVEYKFEMNYNTQQHMMSVLGGHSGSKWFYFINFDHNYGYAAPFVIPIAIVILWSIIRKKEYFLGFASFIIIPYFIFSFLAETKMPAYCYLAAAPMYIVLGSFAFFIQKYMKSITKRYSGLLISLSLITFSWFSISLHLIAKIHTGYDSNNTYRINKVGFTDYFKNVGKTVPKDYVIFGLPYDCEIEMMFYTGNMCYPVYPDANDCVRIKKSGLKIAVIRTKQTPAFLLQDPTVLKLNWL